MQQSFSFPGGRSPGQLRRYLGDYATLHVYLSRPREDMAPFTCSSPAWSGLYATFIMERFESWGSTHNYVIEKKSSTQYLLGQTLLRRSPLTASCWLSHCFEYMGESAGEERKEPLPNNVCEYAFQRTNRAILSLANFFTIYLGRHFSLNINVSCCSGNR